jgi:hypothetical protein
MIGVSLFFIIVQGITMGDEKVKKWLASFMISICMSVFLTKPIHIVLTTFLLILICRKSKDETDTPHELDDDETCESKRNLNKDQRFEKYRDYTITTDAGKLSPEELNEARKNRESEIMFWKMIKEVGAFYIFLMILFAFSYASSNPNAYRYKSQLSNFLIDEDFDKVSRLA